MHTYLQLYAFEIEMAQTRLNTSEEHCKISKDAKFERDLLKNNKDIALQKHCILRLYNVWWGQVLCPPPYKRL